MLREIPSRRQEESEFYASTESDGGQEQHDLKRYESNERVPDSD